MQKLKKGMTVYVNSAWSVAEECTILDCIESESDANKKFYEVHSSVYGGTFGATKDCIFATKEEACKAYKKIVAGKPTTLVVGCKRRPDIVYSVVSKFIYKNNIYLI